MQIDLGQISVFDPTGLKIFGSIEPAGLQPSGIILQSPPAQQSYLPVQQNIPEQIRQSPKYEAVLQKLKEVWPCFVDKQGQIFPQPPNPQCANIWKSLHQTVPPQFHLQLMRDLLFVLKQPPKEDGVKKYIPWILVGGGVALYFLLS